MFNYELTREIGPAGERTVAVFRGNDPENVRFLNDLMRADLEPSFFSGTLVSLLDSVLAGDVSYIKLCAGPFDLTVEGEEITVEDIESGLDWNHVTLPVRDLRTFVLEWNRFDASHSNNIKD